MLLDAVGWCTVCRWYVVVLALLHLNTLQWLCAQLVPLLPRRTVTAMPKATMALRQHGMQGQIHGPTLAQVCGLQGIW